MFSSFSALAGCIAYLATSVVCGPSAITPSTTPVTEPALFTAIATLGKALMPIPIPGGQRALEPITGGNVTGPALNATIGGGLAYPRIINNGTIEDAEIILYATTPDKMSCFIQISGIGSTMGQVARIQLEIGGRYSALADTFILASIDPNEDKTVVKVTGYEVKQS